MPDQINSESEPAFLPKVSVVIPIYNGEADLPALINCLLSQTYPPQLVEYLLVDNNSSDRTQSILQTTALELTQKITIHPLQEPKIQSSYAARNVGIKAARSEIIAFTDADCRPQPNWLQDLIKPFVNSEVGIVVGEITSLPGKTFLEKYADRQNVLSQKHTLAHSFCSYGQTANLAIRRQVFTQVGLFRPYLTTGGDADICWRVQKQSNWQLYFAANAIVQHRHRATLKEWQSQWRRYGRSNRYLHELHGIDLMEEWTVQKYIHRLCRWVLKELPVTSVKALLGKTPAVDILGTPFTLVGTQARALGQREAKLPESAKAIEWLAEN